MLRFVIVLTKATRGRLTQLPAKVLITVKVKGKNIHELNKGIQRKCYLGLNEVKSGLFSV